MTWMNEYDIEEALRLTAYHELPNLRRAAEALSNLKDWTNSKSDGWPYWQLPAKAADRLMGTLQAKTSALYRGDTDDITEPELKKLLTPIKSFLTRQGANHEEVLRTAAPVQLEPEQRQVVWVAMVEGPDDAQPNVYVSNTEAELLALVRKQNDIPASYEDILDWSDERRIVLLWDSHYVE